MQTISVLVENNNDNSKGILKDKSEFVINSLEVSGLKEQFAQMANSLSDLFENATKIGAFGLDTIQVGLEVSAEGGVHLIGSAKATAKAAITLTYKHS